MIFIVFYVEKDSIIVQFCFLVNNSFFFVIIYDDSIYLTMRSSKINTFKKSLRLLIQFCPTE